MSPTKSPPGNWYPQQFWSESFGKLPNPLWGIDTLPGFTQNLSPFIYYQIPSGELIHLLQGEFEFPKTYQIPSGELKHRIYGVVVVDKFCSLPNPIYKIHCSSISNAVCGRGGYYPPEKLLLDGKCKLLQAYRQLPLEGAQTISNSNAESLLL